MFFFCIVLIPFCSQTTLMECDATLSCNTVRQTFTFTDRISICSWWLERFQILDPFCWIWSSYSLINWPASQTLRTWFTVWKMCKRPGYMILVNRHSKLLTCSWPFGSGYKFNTTKTLDMYNFSFWHFAFFWQLAVARQSGNRKREREWGVNLKSLSRLGVWILHVSAVLFRCSCKSSFKDWTFYRRSTTVL